MKKSVILQWNFEKERDSDLIEQYSPIYLLMASQIIEENGKEIDVPQVQSVNEMINSIEDMILNSDCPSTWKVTFEKVS